MGVCLDGLCGDGRESFLAITTTTSPTPISKSFFKALKGKGGRGGMV